MGAEGVNFGFLKVCSPDPTGQAGLDIKNNFEELTTYNHRLDSIISESWFLDLTIPTLGYKRQVYICPTTTKNNVNNRTTDTDNHGTNLSGTSVIETSNTHAVIGGKSLRIGGGSSGSDYAVYKAGDSLPCLTNNFTLDTYMAFAGGTPGDVWLYSDAFNYFTPASTDGLVIFFDSTASKFYIRYYNGSGTLLAEGEVSTSGIDWSSPVYVELNRAGVALDGTFTSWSWNTGDDTVNFEKITTGNNKYNIAVIGTTDLFLDSYRFEHDINRHTSSYTSAEFPTEEFSELPDMDTWIKSHYLFYCSQTNRDTWQSGTSYYLTNLIYEDGDIFECTTAGISGGGEPTWSTADQLGDTINDNTVVWKRTKLGTFRSPIRSSSNPSLCTLDCYVLMPTSPLNTIKYMYRGHYYTKEIKVKGAFATSARTDVVLDIDGFRDILPNLEHYPIKIKAVAQNINSNVKINVSLTGNYPPTSGLKKLIGANAYAGIRLDTSGASIEATFMTGAYFGDYITVQCSLDTTASDLVLLVTFIVVPEDN